ncbi:hypothetical protein H696_04777 [Fonticula alba]|uniref:Methyltransferase FkbM domain-containing protein n=1 Tax=Fonticula alba TaxID=691883 RepID=A0A058Z2J9_FONAL|nr:hypothetical protein H696_04777 [Fonticula alba]KCV68484.1 hypothetical protein H696_04777 [Fonticula alba]|eukprot:XP_009496916.1 hypothetical protein H696_04777 [Fonticula alba]
MYASSDYELGPLISSPRVAKAAKPPTIWTKLRMLARRYNVILILTGLLLVWTVVFIVRMIPHATERMNNASLACNYLSEARASLATRVNHAAKKLGTAKIKTYGREGTSESLRKMRPIPVHAEERNFNPLLAIDAHLVKCAIRYDIAIEDVDTNSSRHTHKYKLKPKPEAGQDQAPAADAGSKQRRDVPGEEAGAGAAAATAPEAPARPDRYILEEKADQNKLVLSEIRPDDHDHHGHSHGPGGKQRKLLSKSNINSTNKGHPRLVLCNPKFFIRKPCVAYSFRSGSIPNTVERAFGGDLLGCVVHYFDPLMSPFSVSVVDIPDDVQSHQIGIGPSRSFRSPFSETGNGHRSPLKTLGNIASGLGHTPNGVDIVAIDIAGDERTVIPHMLRDIRVHRLRIKMLLITFHDELMADGSKVEMPDGQALLHDLLAAGFIPYNRHRSDSHNQTNWAFISEDALTGMIG